MATNRTLQFAGYAYGNTPVTVTAIINNTVVFSSTVTTLDQDIPLPGDIDLSSRPVLFSVENSDLFPTDFSGSYPMTLTANGGYGIAVCVVQSNYMANNPVVDQTSTMLASAINGTTLTIGSVSSGSVFEGQVLTGSTIMPGTHIVSGSDLTWTVNNSQSVLPTTITGTSYKFTPGNATGFVNCFSGIPTNSEGTPDCRSSVTINGITQVPPNPPSKGGWTWVVESGQLLACDFNISLGNET